MKSIKEKSEDLYPDKKVVLARGNTCLSCGRVKRESFEEGANYVLDEIENVIKSDRILGNPFPSLEMRYNQIINVIEQLKGNQ